MLSSEIRELSTSEIETRIKDLEEERFRLQFRQQLLPPVTCQTFLSVHE